MSDRGRRCHVQHTMHDAHSPAPRRLHTIHAHQHTDGNGNGNGNVRFKGVKNMRPERRIYQHQAACHRNGAHHAPRAYRTRQHAVQGVVYHSTGALASGMRGSSTAAHSGYLERHHVSTCRSIDSHMARARRSIDRDTTGQQWTRMQRIPSPSTCGPGG
jgi:hypothetical protein